MTNRRLGARRGFTLVEILIVVIILGILAAIVIPQFTNASQNARESSLQSTLQTLRSQIQLFKLQHGDTLPNLVTDWTPLTASTTYGNPAQTFGPYMQAVPSNPLNGCSGVVDAGQNLTGATPATLSGLTCAAGSGFVYDYNSGNGSGLIYGTNGTDATNNTGLAGTGTGATFVAY
ncbi:MAG: prepilin-type N-terminal cleavage/methylation domain-containing protein [Tepidisphaeraceae bacterium]|jgi:general secretion pathway protein G